MEKYSIAIAIVDRPKIAEYKSETSTKITHTSLSNVSLWDRLLLFVDSIAGCVFGAHIGFFVGWLVGFVSGISYVKYFEPVYIYDISQLSHWELLPYRVASDCAIIGIIAGVIFIKIAERRLLRHNIISLSED
jgi:NhaP-type Na+/H+ or K+/H+ antiporter